MTLTITDRMARLNSSDKNLILIGMPGCGKTTIGKKAAEALGIPFIDVDQFIEEKEGRTISEIFKEGEEAFRRLETKYLREALSKPPRVVSTGGGVVTTPSNLELFKGSVVIFINRPLDRIYSDIDIESRPLLKGKPERLEKIYIQRIPLYREFSDYEIENCGEIDETLKGIIEIYTKSRIGERG